MTARISVIVPCLDEAGTIGGLLAALAGQTDIDAEVEVLIIDGGSTDGTQQVVQAFAEQHPALAIKLIENRQRTIPTALNLGIQQAKGDILIRLDAHSAPAPDYIARCLQVLEKTGAANVGGVWRIRPGGPGWRARSIAVAAAHPLGAGDARYRISGQAGPVETVPFGAFRREWLDRVGPFNEALLTNEDYEMNLRLRQAGGLVWFDPEIQSTYYARASLGQLARQYARYGYWKARMLLRYPASLRWRQALPPLFALSGLGLAAAAPFSPMAAALLAVEWALYLLALASAGVQRAVQQRQAGLIIGLPVALVIMHLAWGAAFWVGLVAGLVRGGRQPTEATP